MVAVPVGADAPESARDVPEYWDDACRHLVKRDRVMKKLIPKFGDARLQSNGDAFTTRSRAPSSGSRCRRSRRRASGASWSRAVDGQTSSCCSPRPC